jgi:CDP-glucose 4,6-dehydratase
MTFSNVFKDKTVLITGHTGFKGVWLSRWLLDLGARVVGISVDIPTQPSHFDAIALKNEIEDHRLDILDFEALQKIIVDCSPDFIFHLAAQSLVKSSYQDPVNTWQVNTMGTIHVLESLRNFKHNCVAIFITSDKCYDNVEWTWGYRETDSLGGGDPYSASKGGAEFAIRSYVKSFFPQGGNITLGIGRAGNVIGGGDWAADRIVPDCMRSWADGNHVELRNPNATRPWQHVLEPLGGYLSLAACLSSGSDLHGEPFNFGPPANQNYSVGNLVNEMKVHWDRVDWSDVSSIYRGPKEAGLLKLNCDKALHLLGWQAVWDFPKTVATTVGWYKAFYEGNETQMAIRDVTSQQINEYMQSARLKGLAWAI